MSLDAIVNKAVNEAVPDSKETKVEETPEGVELTVEESAEESEEAPEESNESSVDEESTDDENLSEEEAQEAKKLYKALKDPKTAKEVLALLAKQTGLDEVDSKKDIKESKKGILDILKNALGEEYSFLSDRLGKGIEEILNQEKAERDNERQQEVAKRIQGETVVAWNSLVKETNGDAKKLESKMQEIAKEILPGPNTTPKQYLRRLYTIASAGKSGVENPKKIINTIQKNANDTSGRLRATGGNEGKSPETFTGKGIGKAVDFVFDQMTKKGK